MTDESTVQDQAAAIAASDNGNVDVGNYQLQLIQVIVEIRYLSLLWWDRRGSTAQKIRSELEFDNLVVPIGLNDLAQPFTFINTVQGVHATASHDRLTYTQNSEAIDVSAFANKSVRFVSTILDGLAYSEPVGRIGVRFFYRVISEQDFSTFVLNRLSRDTARLRSEGIQGGQYLAQIVRQIGDMKYTVSLYGGLSNTPQFLMLGQTPVIDLDYYKENWRNMRDLFGFILGGHTLSEKELPYLIREVF